MTGAQHTIRLSAHVRRALENGDPVVAFESTVLAHGLPFPLNIDTARACEEAARQTDVMPATIGIVNGEAVIGLTDSELEVFARGGTDGGSRIEKVSLNNMAGVVLRRHWGATTVAATMHIAFMGGLRVFATGGIGGVHRGVAASFDISADLTALGRLPLVCVCAGAKAILDLAKTVEHLETLGVPVVGYQTEEFPAFYSHSSGLPVDITVRSPEEAAELVEHHYRTGITSAVLVCVPVPADSEMPAGEVESAIEEAVDRAARSGIRGRELTPFLLAQLERISGGKTLQANRALLINNARVASQIAKCLASESRRGTN